MDLNKAAYIGIDVGGVTSPTAISAIVIEKNKYKIKCVYPIQPLIYYNKSVTRNIIAFVIKTICKQHKNKIVTVEEAFLQGQANKGFLKIIGCIEDVIKVHLLVAPTSIKKQITGSGKTEKDEMAKKLLDYDFDRKSKNIIKKLIQEEKWDETDSIAIALCGLLNYIKSNGENNDVQTAM